MTHRDDGVKTPIVASDAPVPLEDASFLRSVLEAIPSFVVRLDPEQRINYINHLRDGVTLDQVLGRPARDFVAPEDLERYQRAVDEALRTGKTCSYLVRGSRSVTSRGAAYYEGHAVPIDHGDGRRAVCVVATDVSERMARADALQESEERLRVAVEATGIGLWTWDIANDRVEWDQRMTTIVGSGPMSTEEYAARVVHPDDRGRIATEIADASGGRPHFVEHRIVRPDGEVRWVLPCGRIIKDEEGRVVRMTGGTLDVTAQRMLEERLRSAQKLDAVGSLTAGISHNFNNMLAVIIPALELAQRDAAPDQAQVLEDALHAARRGTELISHLMTFAGQRQAPAVEPHDLSALVERTVSMCERTFEHKVRIDRNVDRHCSLVACEPQAIEQVLLNLLINARDALIAAERPDPCVTVELSEVLAARPEAPAGEQSPYVRICVRDNGAGMTDIVKQRLFEPFYTTKEAGKGTGLGLSTSYRIVQDHGGFISFESQVELGTTASVYLPLAPDPGVRARSSPVPALAASRGTILVVDDEPAIRHVVELLLRERGHDVHVAVDGPSAVAALDQGLRPQVILLDRSLPRWSVMRTIDEIRKRLASVSILYFTGQLVPDDERAQVQGVLYKPLSSEELVGSVEHWLAQRG